MLEEVSHKNARTHLFYVFKQAMQFTSYTEEYVKDYVVHVSFVHILLLSFFSTNGQEVDTSGRVRCAVVVVGRRRSLVYEDMSNVGLTGDQRYPWKNNPHRRIKLPLR